MRKIFYLFLSVTVTVSIYSCKSSGDNTGIEYAPDMYVSKGYEPFSQTRHMAYNPGGMTMRLPVTGTIARGQLDYIYNIPDSPEGYEAASANTNPVVKTKFNLAEGERLYNIYCWSCHGKEGKNDGPVITEGKFAKPPFANYQEPYIQTLSEGKIFHVITYGKNMMGPHAHLLTPTERWKVVNYVKKLSLGEALKTEGDPSEQITGNDFDEKKMEVIDVPVEQLELLDKAFKKIEFGPGNADLLPSSYPGLTKVVQYLVENPSYRIFLQGHTESGKDEVKNITLSRDRVKALEKYFVTSGIVAERVEYKGFGSGMPIADNTTEAGRQKNRRIEFTLIK